MWNVAKIAKIYNVRGSISNDIMKQKHLVENYSDVSKSRTNFNEIAKYIPMICYMVVVINQQ